MNPLTSAPGFPGGVQASNTPTPIVKQRNNAELANLGQRGVSLIAFENRMFVKFRSKFFGAILEHFSDFETGGASGKR